MFSGPETSRYRLGGIRILSLSSDSLSTNETLQTPDFDKWYKIMTFSLYLIPNVIVDTSKL